ncbi:MAG: 2OG-Fe(II) oxygenase [Alphaproteobacteria bacterium]
MLTAGDIFPSIKLLTEDGSAFDLAGDDIAGTYRILVLCGDLTSARAMAELGKFKAAHDEIATAAGYVFSIIPQAIEEAGPLLSDLALPFPTLSNPGGELSETAAGAVTTIVIRPNHHVTAIFDDDVDDHARAALDVIGEDAENRKSRVIARHPPVLIVPNVLSRKDCEHLIGIYNFQGNVMVEPGHGSKNMTTDYKMRIDDYDREDRVDHWVINPETTNFVTNRLRARLFPEIEKAFHYKITRHERYRIGSYSGERRGEAHGHRDNTEEIVAHRRFAASVNLNSEQFEGGELRFPEYGGHLYRPETGAAIVFSSSMLHEAMHVTKGQRFVLLSFLFGDH